MSTVHHALAPWSQWNVDLFQEIHATAASPHWLIATARILTAWPLYLVLGLALWHCIRHRDGAAAGLMVAAWVIANRVEALIGTFAFHARPFATGFGPAFMAHAADNSMPSSHVTTGVIVVIVLALRHRRRSSVLAAALTLAVAWARVYVGIHWPADMVGAVIIAAASTASVAVVFWLARRGWSRWHRRIRPAAEPPMSTPQASAPQVGEARRSPPSLRS